MFCHKGFTLIELLVTITIIAIISVVAIPNLRKFNQGQSISNISQDVLNAARQAQTNAQSGIKCSNGNNSVSWSIKLTKNDYSINAVCHDPITGADTLIPQIGPKIINPATLSPVCPGSIITFDSVTYSSSKVTLPCTNSDGNFVLKLADSTTPTQSFIQFNPSGLVTIDQPGSGFISGFPFPSSTPLPVPTSTAAPLPTGTIVPLPTPSGGNFYVDCASGSDSNNGTSMITPWKSLAKANLASIKPGDSLLLKKGCTWQGPLTAKWNGTSSSPVTITGYGTGNMPKIYNTDSSGNIIKITGTYQVFDGLELGAAPPSTDPGCGNNPVGYRAGFQIAPVGSYNTIRNSKASGLYAGVFIQTGSHHNKVLYNQLINNNMMSVLNVIPDYQPNGGDSGAFGVLLNGDDNEVAYNTISGSDACSYDYGRDGSATEVYYGSRNFVHHNVGKDNDAFTELGSDSSHTSADNTFAYNLYTSTNFGSAFLVTRGVGIPFGPVYRTVAYNNTAYLTGPIGVDAYGKPRGPQGIACSGCGPDILTAKNNIMWATWKGIYAGGSAPIESNNIFWPSTTQIQGFTLSPTSKKINPLFNNPGTDFTLQPASPAINTGVNVGITSDIVGKTVPHNSQVDIGAYEF